jgi:hypothetical protein
LPAAEVGWRLAPTEQKYAAIDGVHLKEYVNSDQETAETISANGLAAVTRTYAKVISDTDSIDLKEMRQPIAARGSAPR